VNIVAVNNDDDAPAAAADDDDYIILSKPLNLFTTTITFMNK
jgi:hypothetical protein